MRRSKVKFSGSIADFNHFLNNLSDKDSFFIKVELEKIDQGKVESYFEKIQAYLDKRHAAGFIESETQFSFEIFQKISNDMMSGNDVSATYRAHSLLKINRNEADNLIRYIRRAGYYLSIKTSEEI